MKSIKTLPQDIYNLFRKGHKFNPDSVSAFGQRLAEHVSNRISEEQSKPELRMSNLGTPCDRKLWFSINTPELKEPLPPEAEMKFLFGDILEELLLFLAKEAGHDVTGQQSELDIAGVKGHRDAVIDGVPTDVKSASSYGYRKFKDHLARSDDSFGYLTQLGAYQAASKRHDGTEYKSAAFLAIDKTLGHICVDVHTDLDKVDYEKIISEKRQVLSSPTPPERGYKDKESGKSGNRELDVVCGYCNFKNSCWPKLRTFVYSNGPSYLTHVERTPNVPEVVNGELVQAF